MINYHQYVAAIAVVDLAEELKRHSVIDLEQIRALHSPLADYVLALETHQDISELMEMRYPEDFLIALWQLADQSPADKDIGVRIGATVSPQTQGLLSSLMFYCDTLGDVFTTYRANIGLVNASESWTVRHQNKHLELVFSFMSGKPYPRCAVERSMVSLHYLAQYYCKQDISLISVEFAFPSPAYSHQLQETFGCVVHFNCPRHAIIMSEDVLSLVLPQRNQYMKNILEKKITNLNLLVNPDSVEKKVRELLRDNIQAFCSIDSLADTLCMSRTTLYRKLKAEGSSFSKVLDEERQRLLYSHQNEPVAILCDLLGFKDASAYYKACKRWQR